MPYSTTIHELQDPAHAAKQAARRRTDAAIIAEWNSLAAGVENEREQNICMVMAVFSVAFWASFNADFEGI